MRELRHQFTVFLFAGGLSLALLEGARRYSAHPAMAGWLRGGAQLVLLLGCLLAGVTMLAGGLRSLRLQRATAAARPSRPGALSRPQALFAIAFGATVGLAVPAALLLHLLRQP